MLLNLRTAGPNGKPSILHAPLDAFALKAFSSAELMYSLQVVSNYFNSDIFRLLQEEIDVVMD